MGALSAAAAPQNRQVSKSRHFLARVPTCCTNRGGTAREGLQYMASARNSTLRQTGNENIQFSVLWALAVYHPSFPPLVSAIEGLASLQTFMHRPGDPSHPQSSSPQIWRNWADF